MVDDGADVAGIDGESVEYELQGSVECVFGGYHWGLYPLLLNYYLWDIYMGDNCFFGVESYWLEVVFMGI